MVKLIININLSQSETRKPTMLPPRVISSDCNGLFVLHTASHNSQTYGFQ